MQVFFDLLVDGAIHEERQNHWRRAVDRHRHRGRRRAQVETGIQLLHVVDTCDRDTAVADFAVNIGALVRVFAVESDGIECGRQPGCGLTLRQVVKTTVGSFRCALAREHARWIFAKATVGKNAAV